MALTPEDVVKKEFSKPKRFSGGYDEGQVDDFLDEIVVELRRLNTENDDLADQLDDCRGGKGAFAPGADAKKSTKDAKAPATSEPANFKKSPASSVPALTPVSRGGASDDAGSAAEVERLKKELEATKAELAKAKQGDAKPGSAVQGNDGSAEFTKLRDDNERTLVELEASNKRVRQLETELAECKKTSHDTAVASSAGDAAGVLALAQRLHDEHVEKGEAERDRLVSEAKAHHDKVISDADAKSKELVTTAQRRHDELLSTGQKQHDDLVKKGQAKHDELVKSGTEKSTQLVNGAEEQRKGILADLEMRRSGLNSTIEELKRFEAEYRNNIKGYLKEQLRKVDETPDLSKTQ